MRCCRPSLIVFYNAFKKRNMTKKFITPISVQQQIKWIRKQKSSATQISILRTLLGILRSQKNACINSNHYVLFTDDVDLVREFYKLQNRKK